MAISDFQIPWTSSNMFGIGAAPVTKSGVDCGAHTVRRKGTHHLERRPGAEGWDCFSMTCPLHRSTGAPWVIPRSHTCLPGSVSDSIWLNDVAICWLMMWDDVGLYSYTIPHIGITRIHDRNSEELRGTWVAPHFALWGTTQYLTWSL